MDTKSAGGARLNVERTRCLRSAGGVDPPVSRDSPWIRIGRSSRRQDASFKLWNVLRTERQALKGAGESTVTKHEKSV